jgi:hypothetical protein
MLALDLAGCTVMDVVQVLRSREDRLRERAGHIGLTTRCGQRDGVSLKNAPQARGAAEALIRR